MDSHRGTVLLILILALAESTFASSGDSIIQDSIHSYKRKNFNNLTCYQCHSETHSDCIDIYNSSLSDYDHLAFPCDSNLTDCMVKRISYTYVNSSVNIGSPQLVPMKTVSLNRTCAAKCVPGCVILGERTRLYFCTSCCTTTKCNVGNHGTKLHSLNFLQNLISLIFTCFGLAFLLNVNSLSSLPLLN